MLGRDRSPEELEEMERKFHSLLKKGELEGKSPAELNKKLNKIDPLFSLFHRKAEVDEREWRPSFPLLIAGQKDAELPSADKKVWKELEGCAPTARAAELIRFAAAGPLTQSEAKEFVNICIPRGPK